MPSDILMCLWMGTVTLPPLFAVRTTKLHEYEIWTHIKSVHKSHNGMQRILLAWLQSPMEMNLTSTGCV